MPNFQTLIFDLSAAASATTWRRLTWTTPQTSRMIHGNLTSGDTIRVDLTLEKLEAEQNVMESSVVTSCFAPSSAYAATTFEFGYAGAPRWVRIVKTGTAGTARVIVEG